ncbi:MAG TPA: acetyl-CoA carboxylase biotin carboxyl carrier protein [Ignavibacteria bacterium]|nr:acetyl-CoA carboxylase biotin carboxyl carrier protein [Ignavibacteria bacterium]
MKTDLNYIKKLIKILESSGINELEIEEEGTKLRVLKNKPQENTAPQIVTYAPPAQYQQPAAIPAPNLPATAEQIKKEEKKEESSANKLLEVRSPIVGTFYRAPSPNADPYVQVGSQVSKGTVMCIIEAMKLMNEIESDYSGKIVKIHVENAQPVEYNQLLFSIEP